MNDDFGSWLTDLQETGNDVDDQAYVDDKKSYKLDLFSEILPAIDRKDRNFYKNLKSEEQNSIEPWILMRWLTSPDSDKDQIHYLLSVNDFVNNHFSALAPKKSIGLAGHKELQWLLLTLCGTGKSPRRKFLKPGKGATKNKLEEAISSFFPLMKNDDIELLLNINSKDSLRKFFKDNGYDDKSIDDLFKNADSKK